MNALFAKLVNYLNASGWWASLNIHCWFAYFVVHNLAKVWPIQVAAGVFVAAVSVKEYYWDKHFETPRQTFVDSSIDFFSYVSGAMLALWLI